MEIMHSADSPECYRMLSDSIWCCTVCVELMWFVFYINVIIEKMVIMTMT